MAENAKNRTSLVYIRYIHIDFNVFVGLVIAYPCRQAEFLLDLRIEKLIDGWKSWVLNPASYSNESTQS